MTIQTTPVQHLPIRNTALALVGGVLAVALGYGVATTLLDEAPQPAVPAVGVVERDPHPFVQGELGAAGDYRNTDWEDRLLMHRK